MVIPSELSPRRYTLMVVTNQNVSPVRPVRASSADEHVSRDREQPLNEPAPSEQLKIVAVKPPVSSSRRTSRSSVRKSRPSAPPPSLIRASRPWTQKRRNRHKTRAVTAFVARADAETEWQAPVAAIIKFERAVSVRQPATGHWKPSSEISFYLSGRPVIANLAAHAIRERWGIDNKSHYTWMSFPRRCLAHSNQHWNCRRNSRDLAPQPIRTQFLETASPPLSQASKQYSP